MAYLSSNEKFHIFSKSPVRSTQDLSQAVNKSGHTVSFSEVWSQDIPWFFKSNNTSDALELTSHARKNDLVQIKGVVYKRNDVAYSSEKSFEDLWSQFNLEDGTLLYNSTDTKPVLKYHKGVPAELLLTSTNSGQSSFEAARVWVNGKLIEQFVSSTDKIVAGYPSVCYSTKLYNNNEPVSEGEGAENFIPNSYAGIIQLNKSYQDVDYNFTVDVFEYVGEKLDTSIDSIKRDIETIVTTSGDGVKIATDAAKAAGISVTSVTTDSGEAVRAIDISTAKLSSSNSFQDGDDNKKKLVTAETVESFVSEYVSNNSVSSINVSIETAEGTQSKSVDTISMSGTEGGDITVTLTPTENVDNVSSVEFGASIKKATLSNDGASFTEDTKDRVASAADVTTLVDTKITNLGAVTEVTTSNNVPGGVSFGGTSSRQLEILTASYVADSKTFENAERLVTASSVQSYVAAIANEIQQSIAKLHEFGVTYSVVDVLPEESTLDTKDVGTIYLVPETDGSALSGGYIEWMAIEKDGKISLEKIGTTKVDISEYEKKITDNRTRIEQLETALYENFLSNTVFNINKLYPDVADTFANTTYGEPGHYPADYDTYQNGEKIWDDLGPVNYIRKYFFDLDHKFGLRPNGVSGADTTWSYNREATLASLESALNGTLDMSNYEMIPRQFIEKLYNKLKAEGVVPTIEDTLSYKMLRAGLTIKYYRTHSAISSHDSKVLDKQGYWTTLVFRGNKRNQIATSDVDNAGINWSWQNGPTGIGWRIPRWDIVTHPGAYWDRTITRNDFYIHENDLDFDGDGNKVTRTTKLHVTQEEKDKWNSTTQKVGGYSSTGVSVEKEVSTIKMLDGRGEDVTADDVWGTKVVVDENTGTITVQHNMIDWYSENYPLSKDVKSVENNKAYLNEEKTQFINVETDRLRNAGYMFYENSLSSFSCDLSSLEVSSCMFWGTDIENFDIDMPNLTVASHMFEQSTIKNFYSRTPSLDYASSMFRNCVDLTTFTGDLSSLVEGQNMFQGDKLLESFETPEMIKLINGENMFYGTNISQFIGDLPSLKNGEGMFKISSIEKFSGDLSSLENGDYMFENSKSLTNFDGDLSSLKTATNMFYNTKIPQFVGDLSSLENGYNMFNLCTELTSFVGDLSRLEDGRYMFSDCGKLTSFVGDLSSLLYGGGMFTNCVLDDDSVIIISETINDVSQIEKTDSGIGYINIHIGSEEISDDAYEAFNNMSKEKGWKVGVKRLNQDTSESFNPTNLEDDMSLQTTPIPYYAKPIEVDQKFARFVGEDGKFYTVFGGNHIFGDDISTYGLFVNEEDAITNMRLTPYVYEEPSEEEA